MMALLRKKAKIKPARPIAGFFAFKGRANQSLMRRPGVIKALAVGFRKLHPTYVLIYKLSIN
jgi:hypothetical protein